MNGRLHRTWRFIQCTRLEENSQVSGCGAQKVLLSSVGNCGRNGSSRSDVSRTGLTRAVEEPSHGGVQKAAGSVGL